MLIIGSHAIRYHWPYFPREPRDLDIIGTYDEMKDYVESRDVKAAYPIKDGVYFIKLTNGQIVEWRIAYEGSPWHDLLDVSGTNATLDEVYMLKMSHRFLKDSPHFLKTMRDIQYLSNMGAKIPHKDIYEKLVDLTYSYEHPNLNRSKEDFFADDAIEYVYDHDSIHKAVAVGCEPAYVSYKKEGAEVQCSETRFHNQCFENKIRGVYEEAAVLALERSVIPYKSNPEKAFRYALMKVCTSITSGWFREFAWENYDDVIKLWELRGTNQYVRDFQNGLKNGVVIAASQ